MKTLATIHPLLTLREWCPQLWALPAFDPAEVAPPARPRPPQPPHEPDEPSGDYPYWTWFIDNPPRPEMRGLQPGAPTNPPNH